MAEERQEVQAAQETAEKILRHINETIRELEGRERLREISANLWIGEGYVVYLSLSATQLTLSLGAST